MKKILAVAAMVVMMATSCEKVHVNTNGGGGLEPEAGRLGVWIPQWAQTKVSEGDQVLMELTLECDAAPELVVSLSQEMALVSPTVTCTPETQYIYSGDQIKMEHQNGKAKATIWFVPLTPGNHKITFDVAFTLHGQKQSDTQSMSFNAIESAAAGFRPVPVWSSEWGSAREIAFRDELDIDWGAYITVTELNGSTEWNEGDVRIGNDNISAGQFILLPAAKWLEAINDYSGQPLVFIVDYQNEAKDNYATLLFSDKYCRCKKADLIFNIKTKKVDFNIGEYYLLKTQ